MLTIGEFTKLFATIIIALGLMFEMLILVFFLALMRVITARWMWRNLRYSVLVIIIVAAIITPTADILNMCLFAAPMMALYAISIGVAWLAGARRERSRVPWPNRMPLCRPWLPLLSLYKAIPLLAIPPPEIIELMWNK